MRVDYPDGYYMLFDTEAQALAVAAERFLHVAIAPVCSSATRNEGEFAAKFEAALGALVGQEEAQRLLAEV